MEFTKFRTVEKFSEHFGVRPGKKKIGNSVKNSSVNFFYRHPEDEYSWNLNTAKALKMNIEESWKIVHTWILQIMEEDCQNVPTDLHEIYFYFMRLFLEDYELESDAAFEYSMISSEEFKNIFSILDFATYSHFISRKFEGLEFKDGDLDLVKNSILGSGQALYCFYREILPESSKDSLLDFECGPVVKRLLEIQAVENGLAHLGLESLNNIFRPYLNRIGE